MTGSSARVLVAGEWLSVDGGQHDTEERTAAAVESALATAAAYRDRTPTHMRADALAQMASALRTRADEFAHLICQETGKPLKLARGEALRAAETVRETAELARHRDGTFRRVDTDPRLEGTIAIAERVPRGPVLCVTPSNAPLNLLVHKVAPALAVGAPALLKPDLRAAGTAAAFADLFLETALPPAMLGVLAVDDGWASRAIADPRVAVFSFTGSSVGWRLKQLNPRAHTVLELGGNAAVIVHHDADVEAAAARTAAGAFLGGGQSCISVQRVLVHRALYDAFVPAFREAAERLIVGPAADPQTDVAPVSADVRERHDAVLADAVAKGARLVTGGASQGGYVRPTVLAWPGDSLRAWDEEAFAPLALVAPYDSVDQAVQMLNRSEYGIHAGLFTQDLSVALRVFSEAEVGGLVVNGVSDFRVDSLPYGGVKASGTGREGPASAIEEYTVPRTMIVRTTA